MKLQTKLTQNGNSWSIRLLKPFLQISGIKPNSKVLLVARPGQITIYSESAAKKLAGKDRLELAKQDAQTAWDEAFEQAWQDIFGVE
jgi:hypothetical protein